MSRYTASYTDFCERVSEVEILRRSAAKLERSAPIEFGADISALCRGSIVLLSSHVEAYIKEVGELALDRFFDRSINRANLSAKTFYHISKDVIDDIKNISDHTKLAEKIFGFIESDLNYWSKTGPFSTQIPAERFNKGFSNPKFDKIKAYFNRFGYDDYRTDFYRKLGADASSTVNMLDHLVDIRNSIAHGDPSATKTPSDMKDMITTVTKFCRVTDDVFGHWCGTRYCSIR